MEYNLCIIKPNKNSYSETFVQAHIDRLTGHKMVLYGGAFPVYDDTGKFLIRSPLSVLLYLIKKRVFKKDNISELNNALAKYLTRQKIDVVLAEYGMVGARVATACKMACVPLVIHFHGADAHHRPTVTEYKTAYQQAFAYASAIVVVSEDMYQTLLDLGAPANKLFLNPYGVNVNLFNAVDVAQSAPNFLAVGRFVGKKAPLITLQAFETVTRTFADAHLWMAGEGPLLDATKQKAVELGISDKVTFTGRQSTPQILELMKKMRCFVQHSVTADDGDMEGTPNTILEASASALPVVSTRHAGIKQAVVDGVTGLLTDEYDVEGMGRHMLKLAGSVQLAAQLGKAGREHILANYNIEKRIAVLDSIIQQSINPLSGAVR
ncbi:MAG: glycosyltransferase family 4 protein [Mucilaginibacter sp.]|uniref:glycosyltransferase family 4 protein n=1 Tax=Mucilaginibacter sp. TaxID=1882438 RepID=UPI00319F079F